MMSDSMIFKVCCARNHFKKYPEEKFRDIFISNLLPKDRALSLPQVHQFQE